MREEIKKIKLSLQNNDLKAAGAEILKAHQLVKTYPALTALEGVYYGQAGNFEQALAALAVAQKSIPRDPALYYNMGCILRATGRLVAAEEAIRKSLHFQPSNPFALFELAQIQTLRGKHNEAILTLFKCIENFNFFFPAYVALTQYLVFDKQEALAIKIYETAVAGAPEEQFFKDRLAELKGL